MHFTTKSGIQVQVDDDRDDLASLRGWYLHSCGYIGREVLVDGRRKIVFLHHMALGVEPRRGWRVDHRNGNVLDNHRENLRVVTPSQNAQNRPAVTRRGTYRGVSWNKHKKKWVARATLDYKTVEVGRFDTQEAAAAAISAWRAENMTHSDTDRARCDG